MQSIGSIRNGLIALKYTLTYFNQTKTGYLGHTNGQEATYTN